jgi:uncharacterized membrane protein
MKLLCILLSCSSGLMLLAAAFVCLIDSKECKQLLQRFFQQLRAVFFILLAVYVTSALVTAADSVSVFVGFLTMSAVAYFVREYRRPQREKRNGPGGAERTPVVPIVTRRTNGDDSEGAR